MTPIQLERIKAYIGKVRYDETSRELQSDTIVIPIFDIAVGQFIADAVNEKLERIGKRSPCYGFGPVERTYPHPTCPDCNGTGDLDGTPCNCLSPDPHESVCPKCGSVMGMVCPGEWRCFKC